MGWGNDYITERAQRELGPDASYDDLRHWYLGVYRARNEAAGHDLGMSDNDLAATGYFQQAWRDFTEMYYGSEASSLANKYGFGLPSKIAGEEINRLQGIADEGMGDLLPKTLSTRASLLGQEATDAIVSGRRDAGMVSGGMIQSGLERRWVAGVRGEQASQYGQFSNQMRTEDASMRQSAKDSLLQYALADENLIRQMSLFDRQTLEGFDVPTF